MFYLWSCIYYDSIGHVQMFYTAEMKGFTSTFSKLQFKEYFFSRVTTNVGSSFSTCKSIDESSIDLDFKKL